MDGGLPEGRLHRLARQVVPGLLQELETLQDTVGRLEDRHMFDGCSGKTESYGLCHKQERMWYSGDQAYLLIGQKSFLAETLTRDSPDSSTCVKLLSGMLPCWVDTGGWGKGGGLLERTKTMKGKGSEKPPLQSEPGQLPGQSRC